MDQQPPLESINGLLRQSGRAQQTGFFSNNDGMFPTELPASHNFQGLRQMPHELHRLTHKTPGRPFSHMEYDGQLSTNLVNGTSLLPGIKVEQPAFQHRSDFHPLNHDGHQCGTLVLMPAECCNCIPTGIHQRTNSVQLGCRTLYTFGGTTACSATLQGVTSSVDTRLRKGWKVRKALDVSGQWFNNRKGQGIDEVRHSRCGGCAIPIRRELF
ncbi:hypothetical protein JOF48_003305 [Arthrobacter stackebrandtii]|uniref:Uncharacterized protein n=1 Tax=Arthrobacter stackebrandtii TaxID=272161 RepID=A0ABS4Z0C7_9MICC|nr:hypothetical protein [Arthrobacter stackebrandtii]